MYSGSVDFVTLIAWIFFIRSSLCMQTELDSRDDSTPPIDGSTPSIEPSIKHKIFKQVNTGSQLSLEKVHIPTVNTPLVTESLTTLPFNVKFTNKQIVNISGASVNISLSNIEINTTKRPSNYDTDDVTRLETDIHNKTLKISPNLNMATKFVAAAVQNTTMLNNNKFVTDKIDIYSNTRTFDIKFTDKGKEKASSNLTILPILALLPFLVGSCLKCCTWYRESMRDKEREMDEKAMGFKIFREGDKEYCDIDFRSDLSTPNDTYSSYMSFLRKNGNYDTVNSIQSLRLFQNQTVRPYDTVNSYRSLLLQRLDNHDSINSYRAFMQMQRASQSKDVEVQVELISEVANGKVDGSTHSKRCKRQSSLSSPRQALRVRCPKEARDEQKEYLLDKRSKENSPTTAEGYHHFDNSPKLKRIRSRSPVKPAIHTSVGGRSPKSPRFKVSFVTSDPTVAVSHDTQTGGLCSKVSIEKVAAGVDAAVGGQDGTVLNGTESLVDEFKPSKPSNTKQPSLF